MSGWRSCLGVLMVSTPIIFIISLVILEHQNNSEKLYLTSGIGILIIIGILCVLHWLGK